MTLAGGGSKRARIPPGEAERARALDTIRRCGRDGLLSSREVDEQIEMAFRARTSADLDAVLAGLPRAPHIAADMVRTHGLQAPAAARRQRPWWYWIVVWTTSVEVLWILVWAIFGGSVGYLALAMVSTLTAFLIRLIIRYRRHITGKPARRMRRL